jgi:hypothetical protein
MVGHAHFFRVAGWHQGQRAQVVQAEQASTYLNPPLERVTKRRLEADGAARQHGCGEEENWAWD